MRRGLASLVVLVALFGPVSSATGSPAASCAWHVVPSPDFAPIWQSQLIDVKGIAADDAWAVGKLYNPSTGSVKALAEHWDGTSWSNASPPSRSGVTTDLVGVDAASSTQVYAAGNIATGLTSGALVLQWNGSGWSRFGNNTLSGDPTITDVAAAGTGNVWLAGYLLLPGDRFQGVIYHWVPGAGYWVWYDVPSLEGESVILNAIDAWNTEVWAVGQVNGDPLIVHWNGRSWDVSLRLTAASGEFTDISVIGDNEARAVGDVVSATGSTKTLAVHWNGTSWEYAPTANPGGATFNGLASVLDFSGTNAWAVGSYGPGGFQSTLAQHWNGQQWSVAPTESPTDASFSAVDGRSPTDLWAVGAYIDNVAYDQHGFVEHRC